MKRGRAILVLGAVALATGVAATDRARAEVVFSAPQVVETGKAVTSQIAVDPQGRSTLVWMSYEPKTEGTIVRAQRLDSAGLPGPVQTLAVVPKILPQCVCPKVAVDPAGRATVVWQGLAAGKRRVESAQIGADGSAGPIQVLTPPGVEGWYPTPAANRLGEALVVWQSAGPEARVESTVLDPAGTPGDVHPLSPPGAGRIPVPAASPDGTFHAAWTGSEGIETTRLDAEGAPVAVQTVSPPGEAAGAADIVVDPQGRPTISWWRGAGANEAKAVRLGADGTPETVRTLSPPGQESYEPRLAIDSQGRVSAVWQTFDDAVFGLRIDSAGIPGTPRQLSPEGHLAGEPQVAAAPDGRVVVSWTHPAYPFAPEPGCLDETLDPVDDVVHAAFIGADGELGPVLDASPHGQQSFSANLALDPLGLPWVTWTSFDGTYFCEEWDTRIQASHALEADPAPEVAPPIPPTPPPAPEISAPLPTLKLARRGRAQDDRILLRARCRGAEGTFCSGALRLRTSASSLRPQSATRAQRKPALVVVARGRYRVPGGRARTLAVPVAAAARNLLAQVGSDWIAAHARGPGLTPSPLLIRLPGDID